MSPFVNWLNKSYSELNNVATTLVVASTNTILVGSIVITNVMPDNPVRITLNKKGPTNTTLLNNYMIVPKGALNALHVLEVDNINLAPGESLECFSNAPSQMFDVNISYVELQELPLSN